MSVLLSFIKFIHDFPGHRDKENLIRNFISMLNWCVYLSVRVSVCLFVCYSRTATIVFSSSLVSLDVCPSLFLDSILSTVTILHLVIT